MGGYWLIVSVVVILAVAVISGALVMSLTGLHAAALPPWRRRKSYLVSVGQHGPHRHQS